MAETEEEVTKWHRHVYHATMHVTIRRLVAEASFRLTLVNPSDELDAAVSWLSSSDLPDPTPFLLPGQLVLTTGLQFGQFASEADFEAYVRRLQEAGVRGIGFGTEVVTTGTPDALIAACRGAGMALLEVPYDVPFVALITWAARELEREASARDDWAYAAQQAISLAAVSSAGVSAAVLETARQLDGTVLLFDSAGDFVEQQPVGRLPGRVLEQIHADVPRLLGRQRRSGAAQRVGGHDIVVQTLGRSDRPRGALALVTRTPLDGPGRAVLMTGIALVEVGREQDAVDSAALSAIMNHVLRLLEAGEEDLARALLAEVSTAADVGVLDRERDIVVLVAEGETVRRELQRTARSTTRSRVVGTLHGRVVALADRDSKHWLVDAAQRFPGPAGISGPHAPGRFADALAEASAAFVHARARGAGLVSWAEAGSGRVLSSLEQAGMDQAAVARLGPVLELPDGESLLNLVRLWFSHNCRWESAADQAGMHRHGLRARVERVATMLGLDLDSFADRAELWALVSLVQAAGGQGDGR